MRSLFLIMGFFVTAVLHAADVSQMPIPQAPEALLAPEAKVIAAALAEGLVLGLEMKPGSLKTAPAGGPWNADDLAQGLLHVGPMVRRLPEEAPWVAAPLGTDHLWFRDLPKVLLIENSSTVAPLSKALQAWGLQAQVIAPETVEQDPKPWLNFESFDLVVFSSPGWWGDFANPPGGPSRLGDGVAQALRRFVTGGGTALFFDIAQWDLEKTWPKTVKLAPLGPFKISSLTVGKGFKGGLNLAPVGVAADALRRSSARSLVGDPHFPFPDGKKRALHAAFALPDPLGGKGWIMGWAFHPFEQDDSLANGSRRLFLNAWLLAGARRMGAEDVPPTPTFTVTPSVTATMLPFTFTRTVTTVPPTFSLTVSPTPSLTESPMPTHTKVLFTLTKTLWVPSPVPPATSTPRPRPTSTPYPTPRPLLATATPRPLPTKAMVLPLPPLPTRGVPRPLATATIVILAPVLVLPTEVPTTIPLPTKTFVAMDPGPSVQIRLGCIASAPEPFDEGGVYLEFCLAESAQVLITVFDFKGHKLWQDAAHELAAGRHQAYFSGKIRGVLVSPGPYLFEILARYSDGRKEARQGSMRKVLHRR